MQKNTPISAFYQSDNPKQQSEKEARKSMHNDFINFVHGDVCYCIHSRCCEILLQNNKNQLLVAGSCNGATNCVVVTIFSPEEATVSRRRLHSGQCGSRHRWQSSWRDDCDGLVNSESCGLLGRIGEFQIGNRKGERSPAKRSRPIWNFKWKSVQK